MAEVILKAEKREIAGKVETKIQRKNGFVPVNLYGPNRENQNYYVQVNDFQKVVSSGAKKFNLETPDGTSEVIVREIQRHPVSWDLLHIDLFAVVADKAVTVKVPLRFEGVPFGVKNMGGVLVLNTRSIAISCLPADIPNEIVLDVSPLKMNETFHARDIKLEKIEVVTRPVELLCRVVVTRAALAAKLADEK